MNDIFEAVHVHSLDAKSVIEDFRTKGYVLHQRTTPTIAAQPGFVKLIFVPEGQPMEQPKNRRFWLF